MEGIRTPMLDGAQGSTTADLAGCHASVFASGALVNHGSGWSGFCCFDNHGSFNGAALDATLPFPLAAAVAAFNRWSSCNQSSVDDPDATDGEWLRAFQLSTLLAPANDGIGGCLEMAPVFVFHGSVAAGDARPHGSDACEIEISIKLCVQPEMAGSVHCMKVLHTGFWSDNGIPHGSLGCDGPEIEVAPNDISNKSIKWLACCCFCKAVGSMPCFLFKKKKQKTKTEISSNPFS